MTVSHELVKTTSGQRRSKVFSCRQDDDTNLPLSLAHTAFGRSDRHRLGQFVQSHEAWSFFGSLCKEKRARFNEVLPTQQLRFRWQNHAAAMDPQDCHRKQHKRLACDYYSSGFSVLSVDAHSTRDTRLPRSPPTSHPDRTAMTTPVIRADRSNLFIRISGTPIVTMLIRRTEY